MRDHKKNNNVLKKMIAMGLSMVMVFGAGSLIFAADNQKGKYITLEKRNQLLLDYLRSNNCDENNVSDEVSISCKAIILIWLI